MGLLKALEAEPAPIFRWVILAELQDEEVAPMLIGDDAKVKMPWPEGVTRTCEGLIRYFDADDWEAVAKPHLDDKGNFKFDSPEARSAVFTQACKEVRGFNRYTATKIGRYFVKVMDKLPATDVALENGDMEALGKRMDLGVFLKVAGECQNRTGYVVEQLAGKKNSSELTSSSPSPDSPPSDAAA